MIGCAYARYSSRHQQSIADQIRTIFEAALRLEIFIPLENIFFDLAVRGYKDQRTGLNALRAFLNSGKRVHVFLVFSTNRLYRKNYKSLQFVEEEIVARGIRCIFVKSGVDTADEKRWRMLLQMNGMMDEFVVGMYSDNIRAAHEGLFDKGLVCTTVPFGYAGEPIPGENTKTGKPRRRIVIDLNTASWVCQIFKWFVEACLPIDEIVKRLNSDDSIPLGPKCTSGQWTHAAVRDDLANPCYRGYWRYGTTQAVWQVKKDYSRQIEREEPLRSKYFEELRIVSDELWYGAEKRLAEQDRSVAGRKPCDGDYESRPKPLNGIFFCPVHGAPLYVGGSYGHYMFCRRCGELPKEQRPLFTLLPRRWALQVTCRKLAELIRADDQLVGMAMSAFRTEAERAQQPDPKQIEDLRRREYQLSRQIQFLLDNAGETADDQRESAKKLRELRRQRTETIDQIKLNEIPQNVKVPNEEDVQDVLTKLGDALAAAADGKLGDEIGTVRRIIMMLTGGRIELYQQGERKAYQGWLEGRCRMHLLQYVASAAVDTVINCDDPGIEVVIDFRQPIPLDELADQAKALEDQGLLIKDIADRLHVERNRVTKALKRWYSQHGLEQPDGRTRRSTLSVKQSDSPVYKKIADEAKKLSDEGASDVQIAAQLKCSAPTVVNAISHWYSERGLPVPDRAQRQGECVERIKALYDGGMLVKDIAAVVGLTTRSVTLMLQEWFRSRGLQMPDGRSRRHSVVKPTDGMKSSTQPESPTA